jgi:transcriptional regulator with XRE-family HTH domain
MRAQGENRMVRNDSLHVLQTAANDAVKKRTDWDSSVQQAKLPLISSMSRDVTNAPQNVLRQIESAAQALDVSMRYAGVKGAYIAAYIGKSESYVSKLRRGEKAIPEKLIPALCQATGCNLLQQWFDLQAAMSQVPRAVNARLAEAIRAAA